MDGKTAESGISGPPPSYEEGAVVVQSTYIKPQARRLHDADITVEEYYYYAQKTREEQKGLTSPSLRWAELVKRTKQPNDMNTADAAAANAEKNHTEVNLTDPQVRMQISDEEWSNASRAFRTASWGAAFYLITTDILGPYGVGFAMGTLGYGPGIALYTVFGFMAGYSGYLIWHVYLGVDSYEFPCRNYGDLALRACGRPLRHIVNFTQALALLLLLGQVTIQFGQNISQMSKFKLCYIVCPLIFIVVGFFINQIRTLRNLGILANFSVFLNLLAIFISMGVVAHSPPNYAAATLGSAGSAVDSDTITPDAAGNYPAIVHYAGLPAKNLVGSINGLLSGVLAYAGAQLFVEFMAEMKRPTDFLKAMWGAQFFIYAVYMIYGCFIYHYQGQYSYNPSYQGVSVYGWQTAGNAITLLAAWIAAALYGNIGIKVFYNNVLMELAKAPPLITKKGKLIYSVIVPIWWSIAFLIAAAIPDFFGFVSVISASTLMNMTYSIPPLIALGFDLQLRAIRFDQGEGFDPNTGRVIRHGTTWQRYVRGFTTGGTWRVLQNVWHVIYFLASLSMSGLGMYAAVEGLIEAFHRTQITSFSCVSPLNLAAQGG